MPGMYHGEDYDLAGFCVGVVEKDQIIDGSQVKVGDCLVAIASSGPHSNGYSLIRRVLEKSKASLDQPFGQGSLGETLLTPTQIYIPVLKELQKAIKINAIAHITGGGLIDNLPRVLPAFTKAIIQTKSWQWPEIFQWLQKEGQIEQQEMYRAFNVGVGLIIAVRQEQVAETLNIISRHHQNVWVIGTIESSDQAAPFVDLS